MNIIPNARVCSKTEILDELHELDLDCPIEKVITILRKSVASECAEDDQITFTCSQKADVPVAYIKEIVFRLKVQPNYDPVGTPTVEKYNKKFFFCRINEDSKVFEVRDNPRYPNQKDYIPMKPKAFLETVRSERKAYRSDGLLLLKQVGSGNRIKNEVVPETIYWLNHPQALVIDLMEFNPEKPPGEIEKKGDLLILNTYQGFTLKQSLKPPSKESWKPIHALIHDVLCNRNEEHYRFVIKWLATAIQRPHELPEVALIFKDEGGSGKSMFWEGLILPMFGKHGRTVSPGEFREQYSDYLTDKVLVILNEAVWGGSKQKLGDLNILTTDYFINIRRFAIGYLRVRNFIHLVLYSNMEHAAGIRAADRRNAMFEPGPPKSKAFYSSLKNDISKLRQSFFDYLLSYKIDDIRLADSIPVTKASFNQKLQTEGSFAQWIFEILQSGCFRFADEYSSMNKESLDGKNSSEIPEIERYEKWCRYPIEIGKDQVRDSYLAYCYKYKINYPDPHETLGKKLKTFLGVRSIRKRDRGDRIQVYVVPKLIDARKNFQTKMHTIIDWEE